MVHKDSLQLYAVIFHRIREHLSGRRPFSPSGLCWSTAESLLIHSPVDHCSSGKIDTEPLCLFHFFSSSQVQSSIIVSISSPIPLILLLITLNLCCIVTHFQRKLFVCRVRIEGSRSPRTKVEGQRNQGWWVRIQSNEKIKAFSQSLPWKSWKAIPCVESSVNSMYLIEIPSLNLSFSSDENMTILNISGIGRIHKLTMNLPLILKYFTDVSLNCNKFIKYKKNMESRNIICFFVCFLK